MKRLWCACVLSLWCAHSLAEEADEAELSFEGAAEVETKAADAPHVTLSRQEVKQIAGTGGDTMRAVETEPGVARASGDAPVLRGSSQADSLVLLNGAPVPFLFHLGDQRSFFGSEFVGRLEVYPSNFSARYGRATGGIVEVTPRAPSLEGWHGGTELSILDSTVWAEGPLSQATSVGLALRRSNIDFFFEQLVPKDAFRVVAAPVYGDYQGLLSTELSQHHRLDLVAYGSRDSLRLLFDQPDASSPAAVGEAGGNIEFHRLNVNSDALLSEGLRQRVSVTMGKQNGLQRVGPFLSDFRMWDLAARGAWEWALGDTLRLDSGFDVYVSRLLGTYVGPPPPQVEGNPTIQEPLGTAETVSLRDTVDVVQPAVFSELRYLPVPGVSVRPGIRIDYFGNIRALTVDPRLNTSLRVRPSTTLRLGAGLFSQPPVYYQAMEGFTNPNLKPMRALHLGTGVDEAMGSVKLSLDGFYKYLFDRVVGTEGGAPPRFINDGSGRVWGAEVGLKGEAVEDLDVGVAYTLSRSERRDRKEGYRLFDHDQTHVLGVTGHYRMGPFWSFGWRFRFTSGDPDTPVVGAVYDTFLDQYRPLYGATNSVRQPSFHQLDVRLERTFTLRAAKLGAYLEVQNAYNHENQAGYGYSYDYSKKEPVSGLPVFPNLGLRGEL